MSAADSPAAPGRTPDLGEAVRVRLDRVRDRIATAGGDPTATGILAVTKGFGADRVRAARAAGLSAVGENYAQELTAKVDELGDEAADVRWHFIGRLQRNKVGRLAPLVDLWQSVDRLRLAEAIARRAPGASVLVQVNVSEEEQKGGCAPGETADLVSAATDLGLSVEGLMVVGPTGPTAEVARVFTVAARLRERLGLAELSMGMSDDLEVAVAHGSTLLRLGTVLFGPRDRVRGADVRD